MLCDVINYNDVISTTDSLKSVKDICFTDVWIVEKYYSLNVKTGNFWDDPRMMIQSRFSTWQW